MRGGDAIEKLVARKSLPVGRREEGEIDTGVSRPNLIRFLPACFRAADVDGGEFLHRFLGIFSHILNDLDRRISGLTGLLDPATTSPRFLNWLAYLLCAVADDEMDEDRLRKIIARTPALHRRRGTETGLLQALDLLAEVRAELRDRIVPMRIGIAAVVGSQRLEERPIRRFEILIPLCRSEVGAARLRRIHRIAIGLRPAHTEHILRFREEKRGPGPTARIGVCSSLGGQERIRPGKEEDVLG
ncbi:MAG: phage tail protein [Planctomycetota bacterium]|nr:phage tail protein [Planctomycetota bacterium]